MAGRLELLPVLDIPDIRQEEFEVPTGGFSSGNRIHVFFTTDHYKDATPLRSHGSMRSR